MYNFLLRAARLLLASRPPRLLALLVLNKALEFLLLLLKAFRLLFLLLLFATRREGGLLRTRAKKRTASIGAVGRHLFGALELAALPGQVTSGRWGQMVLGGSWNRKIRNYWYTFELNYFRLLTVFLGLGCQHGPTWRPGRASKSSRSWWTHSWTNLFVIGDKLFYPATKGH